MHKRPLSLADLQSLLQLIPEKYPDTWKQIATALYSGMVQMTNAHRSGGPLERTETLMVARMSLELTQILADAIGGDTIYIPTGHAMRADETARQVLMAFRGNNHSDVARQFGITTSRVRQILRQYQREEFEKRQGKLPL